MFVDGFALQLLRHRTFSWEATRILISATFCFKQNDSYKTAQSLIPFEDFIFNTYLGFMYKTDIEGLKNFQQKKKLLLVKIKFTTPTINGLEVRKPIPLWHPYVECRFLEAHSHFTLFLIVTMIPLIATNGLYMTELKCSHYASVTTSLTPKQTNHSCNQKTLFHTPFHFFDWDHF